jgi:hypothetical protein
MACFCIPIFWLIAIAGTIFWIFMLVDCARRISRGNTNLVGWLIVIALTHFLGALIYYFLGRDSDPLGPPRF